MKVAFSTRGCAGWSFLEICAAAKDLGADGIEIQKVERERYAPNAAALRGPKLEFALAMLGGEVEIPLLASNAALGGAAQKEAALRELADYIALAGRVGAPFVRVAAGARGFEAQSALEAFREMCALAEAAGKVLLLETNGPFAHSATLGQLLKKTASPAAGALWDIGGTFRKSGESPAQTLANLGDAIRYVRLGDSALEGGEPRFRMLGGGDAPLAAAVAELGRRGYTGYLSFEWAQRQLPEMTDPGVVLANGVSYIKSLLRAN